MTPKRAHRRALLVTGRRLQQYQYVAVVSDHHGRALRLGGGSTRSRTRSRPGCEISSRRSRRAVKRRTIARRAQRRAEIRYLLNPGSGGRCGPTATGATRSRAATRGTSWNGALFIVASFKITPLVCLLLPSHQGRVGLRRLVCTLRTTVATVNFELTPCGARGRISAARSMQPQAYGQQQLACGQSQGGYPQGGYPQGTGTRRAATRSRAATTRRSNEGGYPPTDSRRSASLRSKAAARRGRAATLRRATRRSRKDIKPRSCLSNLLSRVCSV